MDGGSHNEAPGFTPASVLVTVASPATGVFSRFVRTGESVVLRLAIDARGELSVVRVDGQPLGRVAELCRSQIEEAALRLREQSRRRQRPAKAAIVAEELAGEVPPALGTAASDPAKSGTGIFRYDTQSVTDRIRKIRTSVNLPAPPAVAEAAPETRPDPLERLARIRDEHWRRQQADKEVDPETKKTTSRVFRADPQTITDRIERLRKRGADDQSDAYDIRP